MRLVRALLIGAACVGVPCVAVAQAVDPIEGLVVREIRISGLQHLSPDVVERHLATRAGAPFRRMLLATDQRRLDELRLFTAVELDARLENDGVVLHVVVAETLRLLPVLIISVTDENGLSAGPGLRALNLLGGETQTGVAVRFGGETGVSATLDRTTITPGAWPLHLGFSYTSRENPLYDFEERATSAVARISYNWPHGLRTGVMADVLTLDTGASGASLSADGTDVIPTIGAFFSVDTLDSSTDPRAGMWAEVEVDRLFGDARSWTFIVDGRRFQRLSDRHGFGLFALATFQTGEVGVALPEYLQFSLGGANSVRGWGLGSRIGRNQFIGTFEYNYVMLPVRAFSIAGLNLYGGMQLAGFADLGLTPTTGSEPEGEPAIDGYGLGLRFLVPFVDVIRLDVAWGEPDRGASAYFGVSLKASRQRSRVR